MSNILNKFWILKRNGHLMLTHLVKFFRARGESSRLKLRNADSEPQMVQGQFKYVLELVY